MNPLRKIVHNKPHNLKPETRNLKPSPLNQNPMTIIEQIIANHSGQTTVKPGDIVDVSIDTRAARDFGGANVVKNLIDNGLTIDDPQKTVFTFDCNPGGSDQKYAANQHYCRQYWRQ